ncbi:MAG: SpoVR family protein [Myxococcales bacterium]|nr:SpoVR family protein [Myxococcales bacterium]
MPLTLPTGTLPTGTLPTETLLSRAPRSLPSNLEEQRQRILGIAKRHGLDTFETVFEMCDYDEINMIAAYGGFPVRYPHWRWGMEFLQMAKGYEYGLQKIYELVINTSPSYAYLLDNNAFVDQKLVMAHVYGHVDFFKNNCWFQHTNRKMLDQMANHARRVRMIADRVGEGPTEAWLDLCLSVENLIDPHLTPPDGQGRTGSSPDADSAAHRGFRLPARQHMESYINPPDVLQRQHDQAEAEATKARGQFPSAPDRDVLGFLLKHGKMRGWQAEILEIIRDEAYYFAPQGQTKIMNEGWASYWHTKLMTEEILDDSEVVDYADHHSGTVVMRPGQINPYKIGIELFRDIERRWDRGQFGKEWFDCDDTSVRRDWDRPPAQEGLWKPGKTKIFEVRKTHNDVTFLDSFLTEDFCKRAGLFTYEYDKKSGEYLVDSREFADVKEKLLFMVGGRGAPRVHVTDGNHANRGELELTHEHEGVDIQLDWAQQTLGNLATLWGRPVHLRTRVDGKPTVLHHDGQQGSKG